MFCTKDKQCILRALSSRLFWICYVWWGFVYRIPRRGPFIIVQTKKTISLSRPLSMTLRTLETGMFRGLGSQYGIILLFDNQPWGQVVNSFNLSHLGQIACGRGHVHVLLQPGLLLFVSYGQQLSHPLITQHRCRVVSLTLLLTPSFRRLAVIVQHQTAISSTVHYRVLGSNLDSTRSHLFHSVAT